MMEEKIYNFIKTNKLIEDGDKVVLGVSGGPDSICMLNVLNQIRIKRLIDFEIFVAHVNHGLRENANLDEEFVKKFCEKIEIQCFCEKINLTEMAEKAKKGLEETGRIERYRFFDEILEKNNANKIAIAHNLNDNAETVIMNLLRGSGTKGLIGIKKQNGIYIRPLIQISRKEIEEYLKEKNILPRYDESNYENIYTRNKIRNIVIPYIENEFNPNIVKSIERLSDISEEEEEYIEKIVSENYNEICIEEKNISNNLKKDQQDESVIILNLKKFNKLDRFIQKRIILFSINKILGSCKNIEKIHIDDIIKMCNNNIGNKYLTPNKNIKISIINKNIQICDNKK